MNMQTGKPLTTDEMERPARVMSFSCVGESLYQLCPEANQFGILSQLQTRLAQLNSMLIQTVGNGAETFNNWSDEIKDNYLWSCQMHAQECEDLARHLETTSTK